MEKKTKNYVRYRQQSNAVRYLPGIFAVIRKTVLLFFLTDTGEPKVSQAAQHIIHRLLIFSPFPVLQKALHKNLTILSLNFFPYPFEYLCNHFTYFFRGKYAHVGCTKHRYAVCVNPQMTV